MNGRVNISIFRFFFSLEISASRGGMYRFISEKDMVEGHGQKSGGSVSVPFRWDSRRIVNVTARRFPLSSPPLSRETIYPIALIRIPLDRSDTGGVSVQLDSTLFRTPALPFRFLLASRFPLAHFFHPIEFSFLLPSSLLSAPLLSF